MDFIQKRWPFYQIYAVSVKQLYFVIELNDTRIIHTIAFEKKIN